MIVGWAVRWTQTNKLDGHREYFIGDQFGFGAYKLALFETRSQARAYIKDRYSYIATRPDLRAEPHCWRVPKAVCVSVILQEFDAYERDATNKRLPSA
jgi:hypothetical protein